MSDGPRYGQVDRDYGMQLATTAPEDDGPVWMVNLMKYREVADYTDGRESSISGQEADDLYTPIESLTAVGAEIVFGGNVEAQLLGDAPAWDRIGVVKYATRQSFIAMQSRPEFQESHKHKEAGMETTIVIGCQPIEQPARPEGLEPLNWADVPHPPTDDDRPIVIMHVLKFHEDGDPSETPEHMRDYQLAAAKTAAANGVHISGWFAAEGTILGDGRSWDQVRFNLFPSRAAFMAVVADDARLKAESDHREVAIADTYTLMVDPMINNLAASVSS